MKVRDVIKLVERDGWFYVGTTGDHRHYKQTEKKGKVTIPRHPSGEMAPFVLNIVFKQAQISKRRNS